MPFDVSKESFEGYCKVYDGVYSVSEPHKPGGLDAMPTINNRGFIFAVKGHLLMSGIPGPGCIPKVQAIEKETGLKLTKIVTSGDFHHMSMKDWLEAYPDAKFVHSSCKFPTTRNGQEILAEDKWKNRIELCEGPTFPSLQEEYGDVLEFYGFNQFMVYTDQPWMSKDTNSKTKESFWGFMSKFGRAVADKKFLAIWVYHKPSKQLIIEHNFQMCFSKAQLASSTSMILKMMMKPGVFQSCLKEQMPTGPKDLESCKIHCEQMQPILKLDVEGVMDYHCEVATQIRTYPNKEAFVKDFTKVLKKTGENDPTGVAMLAKKKGAACCIH